jgi:ubiquinone/menaquinone biosynthesis C-methylase UbiE
MPNLDFLKSYKDLTENLLKRKSKERAMSLSVGGEFEAVGQLEYYLLLSMGLNANHSILDIGCGSGRLAKQLSLNFKGRYVGTDIVPEMLEYAEKICGRKDWTFKKAFGLDIDEKDNSFDFVCFFSVLTHLLHEESYLYLKEAKRVTKPGGTIVVSFLEFCIPSHWVVFDGNINNKNPGSVLNQFLSRDALEAFAMHLSLKIEHVYDGDKPHIPLPIPVHFEDGRVMQGQGNLGQSVCIFRK